MKECIPIFGILVFLLVDTVQGVPTETFSYRLYTDKNYSGKSRYLSQSHTSCTKITFDNSRDDQMSSYRHEGGRACIKFYTSDSCGGSSFTGTSSNPLISSSYNDKVKSYRGCDPIPTTTRPTTTTKRPTTTTTTKRPTTTTTTTTKRPTTTTTTKRPTTTTTTTTKRPTTTTTTKRPTTTTTTTTKRPTTTTTTKRPTTTTSTQRPTTTTRPTTTSTIRPTTTTTTTTTPRPTCPTCPPPVTCSTPPTPPTCPTIPPPPTCPTPPPPPTCPTIPPPPTCPTTPSCPACPTPTQPPTCPPVVCPTLPPPQTCPPLTICPTTPDSTTTIRPTTTMTADTTAAKPFECTQAGAWRDTLNCNTYHVCQLNGENWIQHQMSCPTTLFFCDDTQICDYERNCPCTF